MCLKGQMRKYGKQVKKGLAVVMAAVLVTITGTSRQECFVQAAAKKATAIKLNMTKKTLAEGQSVTLKVTKVTPAKAPKAVTWKTSNKKVITVTGKGKVTAKKAGMATITAVSKSNKKVKAICKITVKQKSSISGTYKNTKWSIDKNGLLTVTGTGNMSDAENENVPPWYKYREKIKSAKIEVKGATNLGGIFYKCENLKSVDLSKLDTSKVTDMTAMFRDCYSLTSVDVSSFNTSKVLYMSLMFYNCKSLKTLDLSKFDTSKVEKMNSMFAGCSSLKSVDIGKFNTSNVTDMSDMFSKCSSLTSVDVSKFDTSKATNMSYMFSGCNKLAGLDLSRFDAAGVKDISNIFSGCSRLTTICTPKNVTATANLPLRKGVWLGSNGATYQTLPKNLSESITLNQTATIEAPVIEGDIIYSGSYGNTAWTIDKNGLLEVKGTGDMYCDEETVPEWCQYGGKIKSARIEVTGATTLKHLFLYCYKLTSVDISKLDTTKVINMAGMFAGCSKVKVLNIEGLDTSQVKDMTDMFAKCSNLENLDVSNFDTSQVKDMTEMFYGCRNIKILDVHSFDTSKAKWMSKMFFGCSSITTLDLSNFDMSVAGNKGDFFVVGGECYSMLDSCSNLTTIHTPKRTVEKVPNLPNGTWNDSEGKSYSAFPENATQSIILTKQN